MPEPMTLAVVGAAAITEGIKFLYGQAGELLKRWRERRERPNDAPQAPVAVTLPPAAFDGTLAPVTIDWDAVAQLEGQIRSLRRALGDYVEGIEPVETSDHELLDAVDTLRATLEAAYGQRITFRGENRTPSGTVVAGTVDVGELRGRAAGVSARVIASGTVTGTGRARTVEAGAELYGVVADEVRSDSGPAGTAG
jgi:hypothetical protein